MDIKSQLKLATINIVVVFILVGLLGCDNSIATTKRFVTPNETSVDHNDPRIDLDFGVVDHARGGYFCLPLSRFNLSKSDKIDRVDCSCPCVSAMAVDYIGIEGTNQAALIIEVVPGNDLEIQRSHFESETIRRVKNSTANLAVEIRVVFVSGTERRLQASFLHTDIGSRTEE